MRFRVVNRMKYFLVLMFVSTITYYVSGQDPEFSQFYAAPLHLNPALAGTSECHRFALNFRDQWPAINQTYVTYAASYDGYFKKIKSGLGLWYMGDLQANGTYRTQTINGVYAYRVEFGTFALHLGAQASFQQIGLNWDKLRFGDELDRATGKVDQNGMDLKGTSGDRAGLNSKGVTDFSFGAAAYSENIYGGFAVKHITQPNISVYDNGGGGTASVIPIRYTLHLGTLISLQNRFNSKQSLAPEVLFSLQDDFKQLNVGLYYNNNIFYAGLWARHAFGNHDALIPYIGIYKAPFKAAYSYDITVSSLNVRRTAGAHELSVSINLCGSNKKDDRIYCPRFL